MGFSHNIYFGPYLEIVGKITKTHNVNSCTNTKCHNHKKNYGDHSNYCESCGTAIGSVSYSITKTASVYSLAEEYDFDYDLLCNFEFPAGIAIPNMGIDGAIRIDSHDCCHKSLKTLNISRALEDFYNDDRYGPVVKMLEEAGMVKVHYGLVYYSN